MVNKPSNKSSNRSWMSLNKPDRNLGLVTPLSQEYHQPAPAALLVSKLEMMEITGETFPYTSFSAQMKYRLTVMTEIEEYRFNHKIEVYRYCRSVTK